jgi:hypothetical protein
MSAALTDEPDEFRPWEASAVPGSALASGRKVDNITIIWYSARTF